MRDKLETCIKPFIRKHDVPQPIGLDGRIRVASFVDLLSMAHDNKLLEDLSDYYIKFLTQQKLVNSKIDAILAPKRGDTLLIKRVADKLNKKSGFVRESMLFGSRIEGNIKQGERVLFADGVGSDGEMFYESVKHLRKIGVYVHCVATLIDRPEGDVANLMKQLDVDYRFFTKYSDKELLNII